MKKEKYIKSTSLLPNGCLFYVEEEQSIKQIMHKLSQQEEHIYSIEILEPTLEEAFMKLTKRSR